MRMVGEFDPEFTDEDKKNIEDMREILIRKSQAKQCAKALGWIFCDDPVISGRGKCPRWSVPAKEGASRAERLLLQTYSIEDMHFHDSYDWAMLLVAKTEENGNWNFHYWAYTQHGIPSPQQISQACIEVLKS